MKPYSIENEQFRLSDEGIHLLRNGFNYETIKFETIDKIILENGRQVNNWVLVLVIGLILLYFGLYAGISIIKEYFFANNVRVFYAEQFALPVIPLCLGMLSIYFSIKIGPVLKIYANGQTKLLRIGDLNKNTNIYEMIIFFKTNNETKDKFEELLLEK